MFLTDGRIPLFNNLCEANIKPFATDGRAWLFADSQRGAKATAVLYTLVESAKANRLDIYEYLKYLLEEMPNNRHLEHSEIIDRYMPWLEELPERCRLKIEKKKYFKNQRPIQSTMKTVFCIGRLFLKRLHYLYLI